MSAALDNFNAIFTAVMLYGEQVADAERYKLGAGRAAIETQRGQGYAGDIRSILAGPEHGGGLLVRSINGGEPVFTLPALYQDPNPAPRLMALRLEVDNFGGA